MSFSLTPPNINPNERTAQWVFSQAGVELSGSGAKSGDDWCTIRESRPFVDSSIDLRSVGTVPSVPLRNLSDSTITGLTFDGSSGTASDKTLSNEQTSRSSSKIFGCCNKNDKFDKIFNTSESSLRCVTTAFSQAFKMNGKAKCATSEERLEAKKKFLAETEEKNLMCRATTGGTCPRFGFGKFKTMKDLKNIAYELTEEELFYKYLDEHGIEKLLHTLLTLVIMEQPENPFAYMKLYLGQLLKARDDQAEFPRVFTDEHVEAVFRLMDKSQSKYISMAQYHTAMADIFGFEKYNLTPKGSGINQILVDVFVREAKRAGDHALMKTIRPPPERNVPPENVKDVKA